MHDLAQCNIVEIYRTQRIVRLNELLRRLGTDPSCLGQAAAQAICLCTEQEENSQKQH